MTRRAWVSAAAAGALAFGGTRPAPAGRMTLSFGTYGTRGVPLDKALRLIAAAGFDGVEIAAMPGSEGEPAKLPAGDRAAARRLLGDLKLRLTALMENLPPAADDRRHRADLDRLTRAFELGRDLAPAAPPLVQTVLGGGTWAEKKALYRDRLGDWVAAARVAKAVVAVKPHRFGAMSKPADAVWLIGQLGHPPELRMVYDYSHYAYRDLPLADTLEEALPYTAHVAVKDAVRDGEKVSFALPGEAGTFDYVELLKLLDAGGYRGDVCCEVSGQVSARKGYDPAAAAAACARAMAAAFAKAGVPRG